jgi:hypothetical protein
VNIGPVGDEKAAGACSAGICRQRTLLLQFASGGRNMAAYTPAPCHGTVGAFAVGRLSATSCVFLCGNFVASQCINTMRIGQKLVCPVQFQPFLRLLNLRNGVFKRKVENQW